MNIDWSKAPEGATHKDTSCPGGFWYKFDYEVNTAAFCPPGETDWVPSGPASAYNDGSMVNMAARPKVVESPYGATHIWAASGQFAKRCGGNTWAIWQDDQWLWIGDEFKGEMIPLVSDATPKTRIVDEIVRDLDVPRAIAVRAYDAGYRKFEIVEEDV